MGGLVRVTFLACLQEAVEGGDSIMEGMDGVDRSRRWRRLKQRLGLSGVGCFGAALALPASTMAVRDDDDDDGELPRPQEEEQPDPSPDCVGRTPTAAGMNLAAALAAERNFRAAEVVVEAAEEGGDDVSETPRKVSLMRLLEETDGGDEKMRGGGGGIDTVCCVCMIRKKGAAFIPCGHTFCRVCSREVRLNRGSCPLCNRSILEILDIF